MDKTISPYDKDIAGGDLGYLWGLGVFYYLLIFVLEKRNIMRVMHNWFSKEKDVKHIEKDLDEDVLKEI